MKKYIVVAPKYNKSAGCRVLYRLAELLGKQGYEAFMYAPPTTGDTKHRYVSEITPEMRTNDIVVYPEVVYGNPLKFQNVVRYLLHFPGRLGGDKTFASYEMLFTFSRMHDQDADILFIPILDEDLFYSDETIKDIDCYFVYKGGKWKQIDEFDSMIEINKSFPKTREDLAALLRRTKTLYSYDAHSLLLDEAVRCGCKVRIVKEHGFSDYISNYDKEVLESGRQLENFISRTQKMDYRGKIAGGKKSVMIKNALKMFMYGFLIGNQEKYLKYKFGNLG